MDGYNQAIQEYEYKLTHPYDKGGALYDEPEYDEYANDEDYWQEMFAQSAEAFIWR